MTRWPLPWPEVRPSHLYLGTRNNSFFFFFFCVLPATGTPQRRGRTQGKGSKLSAHLGASTQVWEQPGGKDLGKPRPRLAWVCTNTQSSAGIISWPSPPSPNKGKRSLSCTGSKAHFWRESTSTDTLAFPNRFLYFRARFGDSSAFIPRLNLGN